MPCFDPHNDEQVRKMHSAVMRALTDLHEAISDAVPGISEDERPDIAVLIGRRDPEKGSWIIPASAAPNWQGNELTIAVLIDLYLNRPGTVQHQHSAYMDDLIEKRQEARNN